MTNEADRLNYAAYKGRLKIVKCLIEDYGLSANIKDNNGLSPLYYAVQAGHLKVVKYLIEDQKLSANIEDSNGLSPLYYAVQAGHLKVVKYLIEDQKLSANIEDSNGLSPLYYAVQAGHLEVVKYLIEDQKLFANITDIDTLALLYFVVHKGNLEIAEYLIKEGEFELVLEILSDIGRFGNYEKEIISLIQEKCQQQEKFIKYPTIEQREEFLELVKQKNLKKVQKIIDRSDPLIRSVYLRFGNKHAATSLHIATKNDDKEMVKFLLGESKVMVDAIDKNGFTSLHFAAQNNHIEILKLLIEKGSASIYKKDKHGNTILQWAAYQGNIEIVKYLIDEVGFGVTKEIMDTMKTVYGVSQEIIDLVEGKGRFVQQELNLKGEMLLIQERRELGEAAMLLQLGEVYDLENSLSFAEACNLENYHLHRFFDSIRQGDLESVEDMVAKTRGIAVDITNFNGYTSVHYAARNGNLKILRYLIEKQKALANITDNHNCTPLHYAAREGHMKVVKYLVEEEKILVNIKALYYAAIGNNLEMVEYLIQKEEVWVSKELLDDIKKFGGVKRKIVSILKKRYNAQNKSEKVKPNKNIFGFNLRLASILPSKEQKNVFSLIEKGDLKGIKSFFKELTTGQINNYLVAKDDYGWTPLHFAARSGNLAIVKYLIEEQKLPSNITDNNGHNPLHFAAYEGHLKVVKYLVEEQKLLADITTLYCAAGGDNLAIVEYLIKKEKVLVTEELLNKVKGIDEIDQEIITFMQEEYDLQNQLQQSEQQLQKMNPKEETLLEQEKQEPEEVLGSQLKEEYNVEKQKDFFSLIEKGNLKRIKSFFKELTTEQINNYLVAKNDYGITPLNLAVMNSHLAIVKYLVKEQKLSAHIVDYNGLTLLHFAAQSGYLAIIKYLIEEQKLSANVTDNDGHTPLHFAAQKGNLAIVKYLIEKQKISANITDNNGCTPLHYAVGEGHMAIVKYLIKRKEVSITEELLNEIKEISGVKQEIINLLEKKCDFQIQSQQSEQKPQQSDQQEEIEFKVPALPPSRVKSDVEDVELGIPAYTPRTTAIKEELAVLRAAQQEMNKRISELEAKLSVSGEENTELKEQLRSQQERIDSTRQRLDSAKSEARRLIGKIRNELGSQGDEEGSQFNFTEEEYNKLTQIIEDYQYCGGFASIDDVKELYLAEDDSHESRQKIIARRNKISDDPILKKFYQDCRYCLVQMLIGTIVSNSVSGADRKMIIGPTRVEEGLQLSQEVISELPGGSITSFLLDILASHYPDLKFQKNYQKLVKLCNNSLQGIDALADALALEMVGIFESDNKEMKSGNANKAGFLGTIKNFRKKITQSFTGEQYPPIGKLSEVDIDASYYVVRFLKIIFEKNIIPARGEVEINRELIGKLMEELRKDLGKVPRNFHIPIAQDNGQELEERLRKRRNQTMQGQSDLDIPTPKTRKIERLEEENERLKLAIRQPTDPPNTTPRTRQVRSLQAKMEEQDAQLKHQQNLIDLMARKLNLDSSIGKESDEVQIGGQQVKAVISPRNEDLLDLMVSDSARKREEINRLRNKQTDSQEINKNPNDNKTPQNSPSQARTDKLNKQQLEKERL